MGGKGCSYVYIDTYVCMHIYIYIYVYAACRSLARTARTYGCSSQAARRCLCSKSASIMTLLRLLCKIAGCCCNSCSSASNRCCKISLNRNCGCCCCCRGCCSCDRQLGRATRTRTGSATRIMLCSESCCVAMGTNWPCSFLATRPGKHATCCSSGETSQDSG